MALKPSFDASIYNINSQLKSECTNTNTMLIICLSLSKAYCCSCHYSKDVSFAKKLIMDAAMVKNP